MICRVKSLHVNVYIFISPHIKSDVTVHVNKFPALSNPSMPRTFGDSLIHASHVDVMVDVDYTLPELKTGKPDEVEKAIGQLIAENLVDDGATLQMGKLKFCLCFFTPLLVQSFELCSIVMEPHCKCVRF